MTERTFFRHFADKREVLFDGQAILRERLTGAIAKAPATLPPLEVLYQAFRSVEQLLEDNRPFSLPRQQVIDRTPALQERELAKVAALAEALALALRQRGPDGRLAALAAQSGMATFRYAGGLGAHLDRAFDALDGLASSFSTSKTRPRGWGGAAGVIPGQSGKGAASLRIRNAGSFLREQISCCFPNGRVTHSCWKAK